MQAQASKETLRLVYEALQTHGYRPLGQIVGYLLTEDPTYITAQDGARQLITKIDRDELLREMLEDYFAQ